MEPRWVLAAPTVLDVDPAPSSHTASPDGVVSVVYDQAIDRASVSARTLVIHRNQTGQRLTAQDAFQLTGERVSVPSERPLQPGEVVQVTATADILGADSAEAANPFVWQFRAEAEGGTGLFADTGQRLGRADSRGVAIGDLNGDGDLDAFIVNRRGANAVWQNDGQGRFSDSGQQLGGYWSRGIALGDLDGDGDLDAFVVNGVSGTPNDPADRVWLNAGSGIFRDSGQRLGNSPSEAVELGDLDGDGDLDAVVIEFRNGRQYQLWVNNGAGRFTDGGSLPDIARWTLSSWSIAIGDLDSDGDLDVMSGDKVWFNNGQAEFADTLLISMPSSFDFLSTSSSAIALGDMDGDGDLDALVGWSDARSPQPVSNVLLMNDGHGRFRDSGLKLGVAASNVELGDVDGDGDLDVVTASGTHADPRPTQVWINRGRGELFEMGSQLGVSLAGSIALGDLDRDGDLDAFIANGSGNLSAPNHVWLNVDVSTDLAITLSDNQFETAPGETIRYMATVTNDGSDSLHEAIVSVTVADQLSDVGWSCAASRGSHCTAGGTGDVRDTVMLAAGGSLSYTITGTVGPEVVPGALTTVASVSLLNGLQDLVLSNNMAIDRNRLPAVHVEPPMNTHVASAGTAVVANYRQAIDVSTVSDQTFTVHGYQSARRNAPEHVFAVDDSTVSVVTASPFFAGEWVEVTATSRIARLDIEEPTPSIVWRFRTAATGGIGLFNDGGQRLVSPDQKEVREWIQPQVALGDLDRDGDLDAVISNSTEAIWLNNGSGHFVQQPTGVRLQGDAAVADVDGDGDLDIISRTVWLNEGDGLQFRRGVELATVRPSFSVGDLNGDGLLDVLGESLWLNQTESPGTFESTQSKLEFITAALGDLDADGDLDALGIRLDGESHAQVWLNDGQARLKEHDQLMAHGRSVDIALGDVDTDGDLDAFVAVRALQARRPPHGTIWLNDGQGSFQNSRQKLEPAGLTTGFGVRVALADIDGDGDLDAIMGRSSGEDTFTSWTNDGEGQFTRTSVPFGGGTPFEDGSDGAIAIGDVDVDGDLDIVLVNRQAATVWFNADVRADLSIHANNGQLGATPGQLMTYQVVASNHGPDAVVDATVHNAFPSQLVDLLWTCTATAGSSCTNGGTGDIADTVSLLPGGSATYTAHAAVEAAVDEILTNTAAIIAPDALMDIGLQNDRSIDVDVVSALWAEPSVNSHGASANSAISAHISFVDRIAPATVSPDSLVVHAVQTGRLPLAAEALRVEGSTVTLLPEPSLHAGELVQVTLRSGIRSESDEALERSVVWEYRVGTSKSSGLYGKTSLEIPNRGAAFADLNGDGHLDAVFEDSRGNQIWLNDGAGSLNDSGVRLSQGSVLLGDLDGDGDVDAFVSAFNVQVWLNDGRGDFDLGWEQSGRRPGNASVLADFDGDGDLDILPSSPHAGGIWVNDGRARFAPDQPFGSTELYDLAVGDLDGDGDLDLLGVLAHAAHVRVWLNDGDGRFEQSGQTFEDSPSREVALGDLDGDGDLDAFLGKRSSEIWLNGGDGVFRPMRQELPTEDIADVALGDLDGDGDLDAFVGSAYRQLDGDGEPRSDRIWLNDGYGRFHDNGQRLEGGVTTDVTLADVDGDGDLDAFTRHGYGYGGEASRIWFNQTASGDVNADGQFNQQDIIRVLQAGRFRSGGAAWEEGDWNGDGRFDQHDIVFALQSGAYRNDRNDV